MTKTTSLVKITKRQIDILILLHKFRYLNRKQIQTLLNHKQFNRVIQWLNALTEKKYIRRYYTKKLAPEFAVYSLGTLGRKYLLEHNEEYKINTPQLDRVWREHLFSVRFRKHWMNVADMYIALLTLTQKHNSTLTFYTQTQLHGMQNMIIEYPDAFFSITEKAGSTKRYFLDVFDPYPKENDIKHRVRQYLYYHRKRYWQNNNKHPFPEIIFVCADYRTKNFLREFIQEKLKHDSPVFSLSTLLEIQKQGISRKVLHKVE